MAGEIIEVTVTQPNPQVIEVSVDNPSVTPESVEAAGALMQDASGASIENLGAVEEVASVSATTGATKSLDVSLFSAFDCTMDQDCTFSFTNPAPIGDTSSFILILRGAFTPTFPASVVWPAGSPPSYEAPAMYAFTTVDNGTTWFGGQIGSGYA